MNLLQTLLCASVLSWAVLVCIAIIGFRRTPEISSTVRGTRRPVAPTDITVIIPARNEVDLLRRSVRSLLTQEGVSLQVLIVDDWSTDGTGEEADRLAAEYPGVRVLHEPPDRPGWLGKCAAVQAGLDATDGELLLLADADVIHGPGVLAAAAAVLGEERLDLLSLFPRFDIGPVWEHAMLPMYITGIAVYLSRGTTGPARAVASGAFILVLRSALVKIGGMEGIRAEMYDDVALARRIAGAGMSTRLMLAPEEVSVGMFRSESEAFWGTVKNVLMVGEGRPWLALPALLVAWLMLLTPPACVTAGLSMGAPALSIGGIAVYLVQYSSLFPLRRYFRFSPLRALVFPLAVVVSTACILRAEWLYYVRKQVEWRGRRVRVR